MASRWRGSLFGCVVALLPLRAAAAAVCAAALGAVLAAPPPALLGAAAGVDSRDCALRTGSPEPPGRAGLGPAAPLPAPPDLPQVQIAFPSDGALIVGALTIVSGVARGVDRVRVAVLGFGDPIEVSPDPLTGIFMAAVVLQRDANTIEARALRGRSAAVDSIQVTSLSAAAEEPGAAPRAP